MESLDFLSLLPGVLFSMVAQLPIFLVQIVGIVLAISHRSRIPRASTLTIVALVIDILVSALATAINVILPATMLNSGSSTAQLGAALGGLNIGFALVHAIVWGLIITAIFSRERHHV